MDEQKLSGFPETAPMVAILVEGPAGVRAEEYSFPPEIAPLKYRVRPSRMPALPLGSPQNFDQIRIHQ